MNNFDEKIEFDFKVSVCICTRNRPQELSKALHSVERSTYPAFEVIVSDDSTNDETKKLIISHFSTVKYLDGPRKGLGANRNNILKAVTGSQVLFIDDDVILNENFLDGNNTFSSPSVAIFYRECFVPFDTRLSYLVDCEWYVRMIHNFGSPVLRKSLDIVNRLHESQATHDFKHLLSREIPIAKSSHSALDLRSKECSCVSRNESQAQSVI